MTREFIRNASNYKDLVLEALRSEPKLRYVQYFLSHACNLSCPFCKVKEQKVKVMTQEERREAFRRIREMTTEHPVLSIIGGEPTLNPPLLLEAVSDAKDFGFIVSVVTNGWGLTEELINELSKKGLDYLAVSVDVSGQSERADLNFALDRLYYARQLGILPAINTVITRYTDLNEFKNFAETIMRQGIFIDPLACSPAVPGGQFSNAASDLMPTNKQFRQIVPWLKWKKITTGMVIAPFSYLDTLAHAGAR